MEQHSTTERSANCFDFLRLFAAFTVVVSHSAIHLHIPFFWIGPTGGYWFYDGVPLFFIMSGFLVYRSCERCLERGQPLWHYFVNRFLRIAPALYIYVFSTAIFLLAIGAVAFRDLMTRHAITWIVGTIILFLPSDPGFHFVNDYLNGSMWTIPAECSFYVAVPILYFIYRLFGLRGLLLTMASVASIGLVIRWYLLNFIAPTPKIYGYYELTFLPYMLLFGLGIFWSRTWARAPKSGFLALGCLAIYMALRTFNVLHVQDYMTPMFAFAWAVPLSYAVIWVGHYGPSIFSAITRRMGDLSYGTYIWHMVIVNLALYWGLKHTLRAVPGGVQAFVLLGTFAVAMCSWWLVERRALRLKPFTSRPSSTEKDAAMPFPAAQPAWSGARPVSESDPLTGAEARQF